AVCSQANYLFDVVPRAFGRAFAQKTQAPEPLPRIGAQPEQQRGILLAQPLQDLQRRARVRPWLGVADGDLPAVREPRLRGGRGLAVDDRDLVAQLAQVVRGCDAEESRAYDDDMHWLRPGGCVPPRTACAARPSAVCRCCCAAAWGRNRSTWG